MEIELKKKLNNHKKDPIKGLKPLLNKFAFKEDTFLEVLKKFALLDNNGHPIEGLVDVLAHSDFNTSLKLPNSNREKQHFILGENSPLGSGSNFEPKINYGGV